MSINSGGLWLTTSLLKMNENGRVTYIFFGIGQSLIWRERKVTDIKLSLIKLLKSLNDGLDTSEAWIYFFFFFFCCCHDFWIRSLESNIVS